MIKNWLKIAIINYKKNWLSTFINLFGLTIGLAGFMLILMHWNDEESYEEWNPNKENIYIFQTYVPKENFYGGSTSYPMAERAKYAIPEVEDYVLINGIGVAYKITSKYKTAFQENGIMASETFFKFFPFKLVSGSYKDVLKSASNIAISTETAKKLFGRVNVAGETLKIYDQNYIVTAVYELPKENTPSKAGVCYCAGRTIGKRQNLVGKFQLRVFFYDETGLRSRGV